MFEILEHPADIGFRAFGASLPELFSASALALLSIANDPSAAAPRVSYSLAVSSSDRESLLVDWLNEVLYWYDGKQIALHEFAITHFSDTSLEAAARGEPRHPERHRAKLIVKAATYHQLKIEQRDGRWVAEVFLDI